MSGATTRCPTCGSMVPAAALLPAIPERPAADGAPVAELDAAAADRAATAAPGERPSRTTAEPRGWLAAAGPQTLLASCGVLLVAIAAVVFAAVAWRDLSLVTRAGVLATTSVASAWGTQLLVRRGLQRTAEATGVLAVAVLAVLLNGLSQSGLLDWLGDDPVVLTTGVAVMAAASHLLARATTVRSTRVLAAWFAMLGVVSGAQPVIDALARRDLMEFASPVALAALLGGALVGAAYAARYLRDLPGWRSGTRVVAAVLWLGAVAGAALVLVDPFTTLHAGTYRATLLVLVSAVAAAGWARRLGHAGGAWDMGAVAGMWLAATAGGAAALATRVPWWPEAVVIVPLVGGAVALSLLRRGRARMWALVGMVPIGLAALGQVLTVLAWLGEIAMWRLAEPWTPQPTLAAVRSLEPLAVLSAALIVAATAWIALREGNPTVAAVHGLTTGGLVVVAAGVRAAPGAGGALVGVVAAALCIAAIRRRSRSLDAAVALVAASVVATTMALSTPVVTMTTLAALAVVSALAVRVADRRAAAIVTGTVTADLIGLVAAVAAATAGRPGPVGVAVAVAAACGWVVAARLRARPMRGLAVEAMSAAAFACAITTALPAPAAWAAVVFGVLAVTAAGVAVSRDDRRWLRWVATAAASASSWTVLADLDVGVVEAYTAPPALVIIALAARGLWARTTSSSWPVLGTGLALLTMPTVWQLLHDPADLPRLAVTIALGSMLAVVGRLWRLQSPLVTGVGVLTLGALSQYGAISELVPRWVLLAAAGALLLWLSGSYERQRARASTATRRLLAMR